MKKLAAMVVFSAAVLLGCEETSIRACGEACKGSFQRMVKYNQTDGCVCGELSQPRAAQ